MTTPPLPHFADPAGHTPEERARAVAAILAAGLRRLRGPAAPTVPPPPPGAENVSESLANQLAAGPQKSVTVSAG